jgi:hypothetical protein
MNAAQKHGTHFPQDLLKSTFGEHGPRCLHSYPPARIASLDQTCRMHESTFGEHDARCLRSYPPARIVSLNQTCRMHESTFGEHAPKYLRSYPPAGIASYGWDALAKAQWLHTCRLHYWGDLDTHGFAILHQLRQHFPQTQSLLMDQATLMQHESIWGVEPDQFKGDLTRLSAPENVVYNLLRDYRLRPNVRLEQEHIGFGWVQAAVRAVCA